MQPKNQQRESVRPISSAELAKYLRTLAELQSDPRTGNPALARALQNLAKTLKSERNAPASGLRSPSLTGARDLTADQITKLLENFETSKPDLIQIAKERFSIASSRLNKMPRNLVIETILDALKHEQSLAIIENEAERDARLRSS